MIVIIGIDDVIVSNAALIREIEKTVRRIRVCEKTDCKQHLAEISISKRLEKVVVRTDLVTLSSKFIAGSNVDNFHVRVDIPDADSSLNSGQGLHEDVYEQEFIGTLLKIGQKGFAALKFMIVGRRKVITAKAAIHVLADHPPVFWRIVDDCNM